MENNKPQQNVKKCMEFMGEAEGVLECPICFNNSKQMLQCVTGHHVCYVCKTQLDVCPICKSQFLGTKALLMEPLIDALSHMKLSLSDLNKDVKNLVIDTGIDTESYRKLLKRVLFEFSSYSHKNNAFLLFLNKYLQNPDVHHNELTNLLTNQTSDLKHLTCILNNTEDTLNSLKKK